MRRDDIRFGQQHNTVLFRFAGILPNLLPTFLGFTRLLSIHILPLLFHLSPKSIPYRQIPFALDHFLPFPVSSHLHYFVFCRSRELPSVIPPLPSFILPLPFILVLLPNLTKIFLLRWTDSAKALHKLRPAPFRCHY